MSTPTWRVMCGDARELDLPDESVHAVILSPPYWSLRSYFDSPLEIGREDTLQEWVGNLVECAQEWRRVLRKTGTLWINVGDAYAANRGYQVPDNKWRDVGNSQGMRAAELGLKPKDLIGLPWRLAFALQADGWFLRSSIVWAKGVDWLPQERKAQDDIREALAEVRASAAGSLFGLSKELDRAIKKAEKAVDRVMMSGAVMPESCRDRCSSAFEMVFMFSKSPKYFFDQKAIKVPSLTIPHNRGRCEDAKTADSQFQTAGADAANREPDRNWGNPSGRNPRNVWMFWRCGTSPSGTFVLDSGEEVAHFASWPRLLAERIIKCATSEAACKTCGSPFVRIAKPVGKYAEALQTKQYPSGGLEKGNFKPSNYAHVGKETTTVAWHPTCTCHGPPIRGLVTCAKCGGSGHTKNSRSAETDSSYGTGTTANRLALLRQTARAAGQEYDEAFEGIETGDPCPACSGSGTIPGDVWPDDVLAAWPRIPCTVLDPMAGSGVTGRAAFNLGRSVILNDLNPRYCQLMRERMSAYPNDVSRKRG